jgi:hypothetical protein
MPDLGPVAPAQPDPVTDPITAADQAVGSNDVSAFRAARQAERSGTPLAPAPVAEAVEDDDALPAAPAPLEGERKLSKRQQQINEYERTIAEQKAELARLKASVTPVTPPPAPAASRSTPPAAPSITYPPDLATWDAYLAAHPEAQYEEYTDARGDFRADARARQAESHEQDSRTATERQTRLTAFGAKLAAAKAADSQFDTRISPEVANLRPTDVLGPDEVPTAMNAIAQEIVLSTDPIALMRHLSDHPETLQEIGALTSSRELLRAMAMLEASLSRPAAPPPTPVTSAPPPPTTLGSKPAEPADELEAAVASNDMSRYKALRLRERTAALR